MKRLADLFVIFCFSLFIFLGMFLTIFGEKEEYSFFENRNLAEFPKFSLEKFLSGKYIKDVDKYLDDYAAWRKEFLELNTFIDMNILKKPVVNDIVVLDDMLLPFNKFEIINENEINLDAKKMVDNISKTRDLVESYGGNYYYTAIPCQYAYFEDKYPVYLNNREEYTRVEMKYFKKYMRNSNINFIDMGVVFNDMGNPDNLSSRIDNHYSLMGAYETYKSVINKINETSNYKLSLPEKVEFNKIDNIYMGSRLRKIFGMKEFDEKLYIAKFEKDIDISRENNGNYSIPELYTLPDKNEYVLYDIYMNGDIGETLVDTERNDLPSVLIYGDSFTNAFESLAYYSFNEMRSLDLRHYNKMKLSQYIDKYKPDIVICIRDYESLLSFDGNGQDID